VAALGPTMLKQAGQLADGTITWMTGLNTIEGHVAPTITVAAAEAGRPAPRVVVSLPISVTADIEGTKEKVNKAFSIYPNLPAYRAMLDREGADVAADIALLGDESAVVASIERLGAVGATDYVASIVGTAEERQRTFDLLSELARS
jgi:5,10-methylenetetrahydromethanopterin reductase